MERGAERREPIEKRYKEALPAYCFHKLYADRPFGPGLKVKVAAQYTSNSDAGGSMTGLP